MNKKMLKKAQRIAINTGRLNDNREQYPVEWLLRDVSGSGHLSRLDMIKEAILCMDRGHPNYEQLSDEDKEKANELTFHSDIVDRVLLTTFQWFGTNVGKHDIGKLMDEIRNLKYEQAMGAPK